MLIESKDTCAFFNAVTLIGAFVGVTLRLVGDIGVITDSDGEVVTACQQACPSQAITFGNTKDKQSQVVKQAGDEARSYISLHVLNTRPAITYLAEVDREDDGRSHG